MQVVSILIGCLTLATSLILGGLIKEEKQAEVKRLQDEEAARKQEAERVVAARKQQEAERQRLERMERERQEEQERHALALRQREDAEAKRKLQEEEELARLLETVARGGGETKVTFKKIIGGAEVEITRNVTPKDEEARRAEAELQAHQRRVRNRSPEEW